VPLTGATLNQLLEEIRKFLGLVELRTASESSESEVA